jgi:hypothetical protein
MYSTIKIFLFAYKKLLKKEKKTYVDLEWFFNSNLIR